MNAPTGIRTPDSSARVIEDVLRCAAACRPTQLCAFIICCPRSSRIRGMQSDGESGPFVRMTRIHSALCVCVCAVMQTTARRYHPGSLANVSLGLHLAGARQTQGYATVQTFRNPVVAI
jgi:hypothetical protein